MDGVKDTGTILFCVGAAKAGTTWLYDHLAGHPDCHLRSIKELHYFTSVESGRFGHQLKVQRARAGALGRRLAEGRPDTARKARDVADWIAVLARRREDAAAYLGYLTDGRGDRRLVADITPAYALLPEDRLRRMAAIAPDVRFLFLLRDPLDRLWSHVRMVARRGGDGGGQGDGAAPALLGRILDGAPTGIPDRGDYASILTRLFRAVAPDRLMVQFQEEMLSLPGLARLCGFLGIRTVPADFARKVHAGRDGAAMDRGLRARALAFLRPQYEFVGRLYPDLPARWRHNMAGGLG
jgi:hypothetical protein